MRTIDLLAVMLKPCTLYSVHLLPLILVQRHFSWLIFHLILYSWYSVQLYLCECGGIDHVVYGVTHYLSHLLAALSTSRVDTHRELICHCMCAKGPFCKQRDQSVYWMTNQCACSSFGSQGSFSKAWDQSVFHRWYPAMDICDCIIFLYVFVLITFKTGGSDIRHTHTRTYTHLCTYHNKATAEHAEWPPGGISVTPYSIAL